ncbi:CPBP family intramembrane glutamic endopeptidase [Arenicella chitinivorans]|uniref:CPBP family intramembrane glutamic endopeptidase n=1 Tax=Arenicella chitinivorans TaxID=1329800 RepID=UPI0016752C8B|nr:type II CAAX endopeptidase family protein [Arenicella chitinivorans]
MKKTLFRPLLLREVLPSAILITVLGMLICWWLTNPWSLSGRLGVFALPAGLFAGILLYGACLWLTRSPWLDVPSVRQLNQLLHTLFQGFTWRDIMIVSLLAGVGEELLVRGALQSWLISITNPVVGIVMASIIFGCMHWLSYTYVIATFVLGVLFGLGLFFTESIVFVIAAHTAYDILAFYVIVKRPELLGLKTEENRNVLPIKEHI